MTAQQKEVRQQLARKRRFLDRHARMLTAVNESPVRVTLEELICSLEWYESAQRAAFARKVRHTARRRALRETLRSEHLRPIVEVAHAKSAEHPMLSGLRMPDGNLNDTRLGFAARAIATVAGDHRDVFLDLGFEGDFVDKLVAATDALRAAEAQDIRYRMQSGHATRSIADLVSRARKHARLLDALVMARLAGNDRLIAEWRTATTSHP
jgi:hypothetical protein